MTDENGNPSKKDFKENTVTICKQLSEEEKLACRATEDLIRLSIGVEDAIDLIFKLEQAFSEV